MSDYFSVRHIDVHYDKVNALADLSMTLTRGDIIAVIGANGAGKTTTLRAITGLVRPGGGGPHFGARRIDGLRPDQVAALGIAMVPEGRHVYPFMHVRDNLLMGAFLRTDKQAVRDDLERIYQRFPRLRERRRQQASTLSGGEQQMVAL